MISAKTGILQSNILKSILSGPGNQLIQDIVKLELRFKIKKVRLI